MPDDYTDDTQTTGTVAVGGSVRGRIETSGDRDWFAVTLVAGQIYQFDLEGYHTGAGTLWNPYLRGIYDAGGDLIDGTTNDDGGSYFNSRVTFTAPDTATYYVSAGAYRNELHAYTLSVRDVTQGIPDDYTDNTQTTGAVAVGGSATGSIDFLDDRDWFAVTLDAGNIYLFDLEGSLSGDGTLRDPYLRGIYDVDGNLFEGTRNNDNDNRGDFDRNSLVTFRAPDTATYYVSAGANGDREGTYALSVREIVDAFTAGTDTTGTVAVGGSATGNIDFLGDRDWFAVTLVAGTTYRFDLEGSWTDRGSLYDPYLYGIYDADGNRIDGTTDDDGGLDFNSRVKFTATDTATYYVSAGDWGDYRGGTYTLSVREFGDDFTDGTDTTGTVAVGGSATGEVEMGGALPWLPGDRDWFAVTLEAGKIYQVDLEGSVTGGGSLNDPYLRGIYDADGNRIDGTTDDDDGPGLNSRVRFLAPENATYYVSAGAHEDREGTYRLSVREIADDFTDGTDTAGAVTVGDSATGEIQAIGDRDWFAVTLEMGKTYRFDLEGRSSRAGSLYDPYLRGIYDAEGNLVDGTTDDNDGYYRNSRVTFTATEDATYYVSAGRGNYNQNQETGTYTLSVRDVTDDLSNDLTAATDTTGTVTVGGSATGSIDFSDDRDWFAVTLVAGTTYRFDLEGSGNRNVALYDPYLRGIYDADGNYISDTRNDDFGAGRNSQVTFTATEDAVHYVSAGAFPDSLGDYTLSVEEVM